MVQETLERFRNEPKRGARIRRTFFRARFVVVAVNMLMMGKRISALIVRVKAKQQNTAAVLVYGCKRR